MTTWWQDREVLSKLSEYHRDKLAGLFETVVQYVKASSADEQAMLAAKLSRRDTLDRYIILAGLLLCAGTSKPPKAKRGKSPSRPMTPPEGITDQLTQAESRKAFVDGLVKLFNTITNKSTDSSQ